MAGELVLLTGATGFLGYLTLINLLKSGYRVRAAIRSQKKLSKVLNAPSFKALNPTPDQLSWVTVPDMTVDGAYDDAAKGVKYIIHTASPIPSFGDEPIPQDQYELHFIDQAVKSDIGMLESAHKAGTVERIVMTSSEVAAVPLDFYSGNGDYNTVFNEDSRTPNAKGPFEFEFQAYSAGKTAAINASEAWVADHKPKFDLIPIFPGWIFGRDELCQSADDLRSGSTNSVLVGLLLGGKSDSPFNGNAVLGDECARLHVLALDPKVKGNQGFVASRPIMWQDATDIVSKHFPEALKEGKLSNQGVQGTLPIKVSHKKTEDTFGLEFSSYEEMVKAVAGQYLELVAQG